VFNSLRAVHLGQNDDNLPETLAALNIDVPQMVSERHSNQCLLIHFALDTEAMNIFFVNCHD
jgi:hypothetical protein